MINIIFVKSQENNDSNVMMKHLAGELYHAHGSKLIVEKNYFGQYQDFYMFKVKKEWC